MKWIVYKTTCLINNKIYIGVHTVEDPEIFDGYLGRGFFINRTHYLTNPVAPFHYALIKHGVANFHRETLYIFDNEEEAYIKEAEIVTEEFIKENSNYNVSLGGKGRPRPSKPVYQFDSEGNLLREYKSVLEASKIIERDESNIRDAVNNKRTCKNSLWSLKDSINVEDYSINISNSYYIYDTDGNLVDEFESAGEAIIFLETNTGNLTRAVKAQYKISGYFISTEKYEKLQIVVNKKSGKLNRYSLEGEYIDSFNTVKEAKEKLGLKLTSISTAIKLKRQHNGFLWTRGNNPTKNLNNEKDN